MAGCSDAFPAISYSLSVNKDLTVNDYAAATTKPLI